MIRMKKKKKEIGFQIDKIEACKSLIDKLNKCICLLCYNFGYNVYYPVCEVE